MKQKQQQKLWEKQERKLREMKSKGVSKENAEKAQLKAKAREPGALSHASASRLCAVQTSIDQINLLQCNPVQHSKIQY